MRRRFRFLSALAIAGVFGASTAAWGATPGPCGGSPLAMYDNIGMTVLHGVRSTRSVIAIAQIHRKVGGELVGWLYTDDAGYLSVVLKSVRDGAAFGSQKTVGPFFLMKGLPPGFTASVCI